MKIELLEESKKNQSQPLYYQFNKLKPEILEKMRLIQDYKFQSNEISALMPQAQRALQIIDENSNLKCFYHTHIANIVHLLDKAYNLTGIKDFEDTAEKIKISLKELHPYLMENIEKKIDHSLISLILKNFLILKKIMVKSIEESYSNAEKKIQEIKTIFQPNQSLTLKIWDLVPLFDFFAYCIDVFNNLLNSTPQIIELENNFFKIIQQLYHCYDKNEFFYYSYLRASHHHLSFLLRFPANMDESFQLYKEYNLIEHENENELYQFTKLLDTLRLIKPLRNRVFFLHKYQSLDQVNVPLSILLDMHFNLIRIYEKVPNEFYQVRYGGKSNTFTHIVRETIQTGVLCSRRFLFEKEEHYREQVEQILIKLDEFIKLNLDFNISEEDINSILSEMTEFLQDQPVGTPIQWIIKYLKIYAINLTPNARSGKTNALRNFIIFAHLKTINTEIKLIPLTHIQLNASSEQKFQAEYPNILRQFEIIEKQLLNLKSDNFEKFYEKSANSLSDSKELISIHKNRISHSINHSRPLSVPDLEKTIIFLYEVLSGLDCLKETADYSNRNKQLSFMEDLLSYFVNDHRIECLKLNILHLQFLHCFNPKEICLENTRKCITKLIDAKFTDVFAHKDVIKTICQSSINSFDLFNSIESQFQLKNFIFHLADKHIDLDLQSLNKIKELKPKIDLVTELTVDIIKIAGFLSSLCDPQAVKTNKLKSHYLQKRLLEKLASSILSYKNLIILNQDNLKIVATFNTLFNAQQFLPLIKRDSLITLLNFAKYFCDNTYCLDRYENLELAFAKLNCQDDHKDSKKITSHLSQSLKEKSDKIEIMKKQKCSLEEEHAKKQDQFKAKLVEIDNVRNELQDYQQKEITLREQFIQDKEELDKNHQQQLEQIRSQQTAELLAFKSTQQIQEDDLAKKHKEAQATLAQKKIHLEEIQTKLSECKAQISLNVQTSVSELKLQSMENQLKAAYRRIKELEDQLNNKKKMLSQKSSLNQQKKERISKSSLMIGYKKEVVELLVPEHKDLISSLERELKAINENRRANRIRYEKSFDSLRKHRDELVDQMQTQWQPSFSFTPQFSPQTEMTPTDPLAIYYVPASFLNSLS